VSADQIEIEASLIVSPNPAINQSWLELKTNLIIEEVEIVDVLGKIFSIQCPVGNLIEISELDKGLYLVKVKSENSILIRKLLVF